MLNTYQVNIFDVRTETQNGRTVVVGRPLNDALSRRVEATSLDQAELFGQVLILNSQADTIFGGDDGPNFEAAVSALAQYTVAAAPVTPGV